VVEIGGRDHAHQARRFAAQELAPVAVGAGDAQLGCDLLRSLGVAPGDRHQLERGVPLEAERVDRAAERGAEDRDADAIHGAMLAGHAPERQPGVC
jgi:hypothetical protein